MSRMDEWKVSVNARIIELINKTKNRIDRKKTEVSTVWQCLPLQ